MKTIKKILIYLVATLLLLYIVFKVWLVYLIPDPPPNRGMIRPEISQIMWATAGEEGKKGLEHSSALVYSSKFVWMALNDDFELVQNKGARLTHQCIKTDFIKKENQNNLGRHLTSLLLADAITSYWGYEDVVRCNYEYGYYGHGLVGLKAAATAYFSKEPADLNLQEILAIELVAIFPFHYDLCNPKQAAKDRKRWLNRHQKEHEILKDLQTTPLKINNLKCNY